MEIVSDISIYTNSQKDKIFDLYYDQLFKNKNHTKFENVENSIYRVLKNISEDKLLEHKIIILINGHLYIHSKYEYERLFFTFFEALINNGQCIGQFKYQSNKNNDSILIINAEKCRELEIFEILENDIKLNSFDNNSVLDTIEMLLINLSDVFNDRNIFLSPKDHLVNQADQFNPDIILSLDSVFFEYISNPFEYLNADVIQFSNDYIHYLIQHTSSIDDKNLLEELFKNNFYINTLLYLKDKKYEMRNR